MPYSLKINRDHSCEVAEMTVSTDAVLNVLHTVNVPHCSPPDTSGLNQNIFHGHCDE